jgi:hypothetical protein
MSTKDQTLSAALHGEALLTARRPELQPLIDHLREVAQGRDDIKTECAGVIAGSWFAGAARRGEGLTQCGVKRCRRAPCHELCHSGGSKGRPAFEVREAFDRAADLAEISEPQLSCSTPKRLMAL